MRRDSFDLLSFLLALMIIAVFTVAILATFKGK